MIGCRTTRCGPRWKARGTTVLSCLLSREGGKEAQLACGQIPTGSGALGTPSEHAKNFLRTLARTSARLVAKADGALCSCRALIGRRVAATMVPRVTCRRWAQSPPPHAPQVSTPTNGGSENKQQGRLLSFGHVCWLTPAYPPFETLPVRQADN